MTGRVVLLMVPGEEKKFESSGKRSAAVVTALRDRRGLRLRTDLIKEIGTSSGCSRPGLDGSIKG